MRAEVLVRGADDVVADGDATVVYMLRRCLPMPDAPFSRRSSPGPETEVGGDHRGIFIVWTITSNSAGSKKMGTAFELPKASDVRRTPSTTIQVDERYLCKYPVP